MSILTTEKRVAIVSCLVEGCSIRSTVRLTGVAKDTVLKLLKAVGQVCIDYQDAVLRNLPCKRLELDEIWCYCYCKEKNVPDAMRGEPGIGSMWTWTALDAETKLVPSWRLGARDAANAHAFISDLSERLANRVQVTSDGNRVYIDAVEHYMGGEVDYAQLIKQFTQNETPEKSYSPAKCLGTKKKQIDGNPDMSLVSTSYAERQNLNIRMKNRRFTRLTDPAVTPDREPEPEPEPPPTVVAALTAKCLTNDLRIAYAASESAAEQIVLEDMLDSAAKLRDRLHWLAKDAPRIAPGAESGGLS